MGREFKDIARQATSGLVYFRHPYLRVSDIPAFLAWLTEGSPKPKWSITKEFDCKPTHVLLASDVSAIPLTEADVELVTG